MALWRKTALTVLVWMTAAATLLAGVPHCLCLCPNGRLKAFCLNVSANETGCCCGGQCCPAGKSCCDGESCCGKSAKPQKSPAGEVHQPCCLKSLASAPVFTKSEPKSPVPAVSAGMLVSVFDLATIACGSSKLRPSSASDPPVDRLALLQRLLI